MRHAALKTILPEIDRLFLFSKILLLGKFQNILQENVFHLKPWVRSPFCLDKYSDNPGEFHIFFLFISAQLKRDQMFQVDTVILEDVTTRCPD